MCVWVYREGGCVGGWNECGFGVYRRKVFFKFAEFCIYLGRVCFGVIEHCLNLC